jgi:hypothetical protein
MSDPRVKRWNLWARAVPEDCPQYVVDASDFDAVVQELRKQVKEQKQFMSHKDGCHSVNFHYPNGDPGKCDCGLSAYLGEG